MFVDFACQDPIGSAKPHRAQTVAGHRLLRRRPHSWYCDAFTMIIFLVLLHHLSLLLHAVAYIPVSFTARCLYLDALTLALSAVSHYLISLPSAHGGHTPFEESHASLFDLNAQHATYPTVETMTATAINSRPCSSVIP